MGIELAKAYVSVRGDTTELGPDLAGVKGILQEALSDARAYAAAFLAGVAQAGSSYLAMGAAINNRNEQTRTRFETLIGDVKETDDLLRKLTDFAAKTPFEMPQILQVSQELLTFGERGEGLMDTLKMLGDASGGTADKFQLLGVVFNQIRGINRITTQSQDFRQLSSRGIISLKDVAKYLGIAEAQAARTTLTFEDIRGTLKMMTEEGGKNYKMMEKQSQTMLGLTSTYNDSYNILASKVAMVTAPVEKLWINLKIRLVGALDAVTESSNGMVGSMVVGSVVMAKFGAVVLGGSLALKLFSGYLKTAFIGTGIGAAILLIGAGMGALVNWFLKTEAGIKTTETVLKNLTKVWSNFGEAAGNIMGNMSEMFTNIFEGVFGASVESMSQRIGNFLVYLSEQVVAASEVIKSLSDGIGFLMRNAWDLASIAAIDMVVGAIEIIEDLRAAWAEGAAAFTAVWAGVAGFFGTLFDKIAWAFRSLGKFLLAEAKGAWAALQAQIKGGSLQEIEAARDKAFDDTWKEEDPKQVKKAFLEDKIKKEQERADKGDRMGGEYVADKVSALNAAKDARARGDETSAKRFDEAAALADKMALQYYVDEQEAIHAVKKAKEELAKVDADIAKSNRGLGEAFSKGMEEGYKPPEAAPPSEFKSALEEQKKALQEKIDKREKDRTNAKPPEPPKEGEGGNKPKEPPKSDGLLKTGQYGFAQFGNALQDAILKGKGDKQAQMVSLLEANNKIQEKQLAEQQKKHPATLGP